MFIPRPAKLLFTVDDGWNKFLDLNSDIISHPLKKMIHMHAGS